MIRAAKYVSAALCAIWALSAWALGVGDINVQSRLNQRFAAVIPLTSATAGDLEGLKVQIAGAQDFQRAGIERSDFLSSLSFRIDTAGSQPQIVVTSSQAALDPVLSFVLEVRGPSNRLLREYTVLLDPPTEPVAAPAPVPVPAAVVAPAPAPASTPAPAPAEQAATASEPSAPPPEPAPAAAAPAPLPSSSAPATSEAPVSEPAQPSAVKPSKAAPPSKKHHAAKIPAKTPVAEKAKEKETAAEAAVPPTTPAPSVAAPTKPAHAGTKKSAPKPVAPKPAPVEKPPVAEQPTTEPVPAKEPSTESAPAAAGDYGPVQPQETLWSVAAKLRPNLSVSMDQMLIALYRGNSPAFPHGLQSLRKGVHLKVPTIDEIRATTPEEAKALVDHLMHGGALPVASEPVPSSVPAAPAPAPEKPKPAPAQKAAKPAKAHPPAPVTETAPPKTAPPKESAPPVESKSVPVPAPIKSPFASAPPAVKSPFAATPSTATPAVAPKPMEKPAAPVPPPAPVVAAPPTPQSAPAPSPVMPSAATSVSAEKPVPPAEPVKPQMSETPPAPQIVEEENGTPGWLLPAGLGGVLVVALLGWRVMQGRRKEPPRSPAIEPRVAGPVVTAMADETSENAEEKPESRAEEEHAATEEIAHAEDTTTIELPKGAEGSGPGALQIPGKEFDITTQMEAQTMSINLEANDPLSEADFHLAYGLYDEAIHLLKDAITKQPVRSDLPVKLAETYFAAGRPHEFQETAEGLRERVSPEEWQKLAIMGRQICPDAPLFKQDDGSFAGPAVDLAFADEPTAEPAGQPASAVPSTPGAMVIDFDSDALMAAVPPAAAPAAASELEEVALDLSKFDLSTAEPATSAAAPAQNTVDFQIEELDLGKPGAFSTQPESGNAEGTIDFGDEAGTKLDLARAYVDMGDNEAARGLLDEVLASGNQAQKQEADALLKRLSG